LDKIGWEAGGDRWWETGQSNGGIKNSCGVAPEDDFQMSSGPIKSSLARDSVGFGGSDLSMYTAQVKTFSKTQFEA
jgi:hypothetical protein